MVDEQKSVTESSYTDDRIVHVQCKLQVRVTIINAKLVLLLKIKHNVQCTVMNNSIVK